MDQIQHKHVEIRGLKLHVAELGTGPAVVFLHGFPEIWYSWRYQMLAVANAGYRAIAPDCRGYGLSEQPPEPEKATLYDLIEDLLAILDFFQIRKAFLVGKDFGAPPAYQFALLHPERSNGVITLGVPCTSPDLSHVRPELFPKGFYTVRWKEPGRAEADFGRFDVKTVVKNIYILFSGSELPTAGEDQEIMDLVDPSTPLPSWFSDEDLTTYSNLYDKSGFHFPMEVPYRCLERSAAKWAGVTDVKVRVPALLIMGEKDYVLKFPGMEDYIRSGMVKEFVPDLETTFIPEGTHFVQEQFPDQEHGRAEADFGRFDVKTVVKNIYILFSGSELPTAGEDQEIMDLVDPSTPLPSWFSDEDLTTYSNLYDKSGFRFPMEVPYRCLERSAVKWSGVTDIKVRVPALLIMGEKDYVLKFPGMEDYIRSAMVK